MRRMLYSCAAAALWLLAGAGAPVFGQFELPFGFDGNVAPDMETFEPRRLHAQGMEGLRRVLDELLPDTAEPPKLTVPESRVLELIDKMGDDSYRVRESASQKLDEIGEGARPILTKAVKNPNAEISWRATRLLRGWENRRLAEKPQHLNAFSQYCQTLTDEAKLKELARRLNLALHKGVWGETRGQVFHHGMMALLRADKPEYADMLKPYLRTADEQLALMITDAAGQGASSNSKAARALFLEALSSSREQVVSSAINYVAGWDRKRDGAIKKQLQTIFDGNNENLKLQAAQSLHQVYKLEPAYDYILDVLKETDMNRRFMALNFLTNQAGQDGQGRRREPSDRLFNAVAPLLADGEPQVRIQAAMTLTSYKGEKVIASLIPLLSDKENYVAEQIIERLLQWPDRDVLRRVMQQAKGKDAAKAKIVIKRLDEIEAAEKQNKESQAENIRYEGETFSEDAPSEDAPLTQRLLDLPRAIFRGLR